MNAEEGAHKRYRPKDYSSYQCHKIILVSPNNLKNETKQKKKLIHNIYWGEGGGIYRELRTVPLVYLIMNVTSDME